jgi:hypothetical protein
VLTFYGMMIGLATKQKKKIDTCENDNRNKKRFVMLKLIELAIMLENYAKEIHLFS